MEPKFEASSKEQQSQMAHLPQPNIRTSSDKALLVLTDEVKNKTSQIGAQMKNVLSRENLLKFYGNPLVNSGKLERLKYSIHSYSSYSAQYHPEHILNNRPFDQSSRWSSGANNQQQFLVLRLDNPLGTVCQTIKFGKYHKVHVCNLKEFKVFGCWNDPDETEGDNWIPLLHSGLRNDSEPETFALRYATGPADFGSWNSDKYEMDLPVPFPIRFIKIVPLMAWGANFNFSIWHVELRGYDDANLMEAVWNEFVNFRETQVIRLCLKYFRQKNVPSLFESVQQHYPSVRLENEALSQLHTHLVVEGDYDKVESIIMYHLGARDDDGLCYVKPPNVCLNNDRYDPNGMAVENGTDESVNQDSIADNSRGSFILHKYLQSKCPPKPSWTPLHLGKSVSNDSQDANALHPPMRGGHQMCMDSDNGKIWLIGGWDGSKDLGDFWEYDCSSCSWKELVDVNARPKNSPRNNLRQPLAPPPRSCHKIVFDTKFRRIYLLGRYIDPQSRLKDPCESDFWRYDCATPGTSAETGQWVRISQNTAAVGGPKLIYDHQMCIDSERQILYVFGGRMIAQSQAFGEGSSQSSSPDGSQYSGLFAYDIQKDEWKLLRSDDQFSNPMSKAKQNELLADENTNGAWLKSRIGHSMLLNPKTNQLYILAGQRYKDYLSDFFMYDIDNDCAVEMTRDCSKKGGPDAGFTQRATIDTRSETIAVFSGLIREKHASSESVKNTLWIYDISSDKWSKVYSNENTSESYWQAMEDKEPRPRFAHQVVFDDKKGVWYLFGGNPGNAERVNQRLDDFWMLELKKPSPQDVWRRCRFLIRKCKFREMCLKAKEGNVEESMNALQYLKNELTQCVDHENSQESIEFRNLASELFKCGIPGSLNVSLFDAFSPSLSPASPKAENSLGEFNLRTELYEQLLDFFPSSMKQPKSNLVDLINI